MYAVFMNYMLYLLSQIFLFMHGDYTCGSFVHPTKKVQIFYEFLTQGKENKRDECSFLDCWKT